MKRYKALNSYALCLRDAGDLPSNPQPRLPSSDEADAQPHKGLKPGGAAVPADVF